MAATPGVSPANWIGRPVNCTTVATGCATCTSIGADGQPLNSELADGVDNTWVVTGIEAG